VNTVEIEERCVISGGTGAFRASIEAFVRDHFAAKERCDKEELRAQLSPDLLWWAPQSAATRGYVARPIRGADAMIQDITSDKMYNPNGRIWHIEQILIDGNWVAVRARLRARVAATGEPYDNSYAIFLRVEDGQIKEVWEELDTAYAFERFAAS
jgi:ketosteroid isomerase-like protein